ncbi:chemotaxis protein CheA [Oligoflexus tunisiensis]|uniref:chemotaxis protein CheA n=1 Tax=Oligoflexus tunisiensis TaxID=708132 RepID=UPI000AD50206|nr:chemotaxis protein CheA [Oligoflexus tunisiensis]
MDDMESVIRKTFLDEATQLLQEAEQSFLLLETAPHDIQNLDRIFRIAHNIKGSAKAVQLDELGAFVHELESILLKLKKGELAIDTRAVNLLLQCHDLLLAWIGALHKDDRSTVEFRPLLLEMQNFQSAAPTVPSLPPAASNGFHEFTDTPAAAAPAHKDVSLRVSLNRVDTLVNDVGELVILQTVLKQNKHQIPSVLLQKTIDQLAKITRGIQESSMSLRMVPLQPVFQKMQRVLRDTSKSLHKDVVLHTAGEDIEMDKTVVDNLGDPLVHLIRNAVDHGIESTEGRRQAGKPERSNVWLTAQHQGGRLVLEVRDDGDGLRAANIRKKAVERGLIAPDAVLPDAEIHHLIFAPGFSTKNQVTDVSGRGVGLDVVKTNINQLKGELQLESIEGQGTCFRIILPLSLAIIDGMIVRLNDSERYIVPTSQVHEIIELSASEFCAMGRNQEVISRRGETIPLFHLDKILGRTASRKKGSRGVAIISRFNQKEYGFLAESIVSQQQVVIKQLGRDLKKISSVSGSAILGDGKAALILDLEEIAKGRSA